MIDQAQLQEAAQEALDAKRKKIEADRPLQVFQKSVPYPQHPDAPTAEEYNAYEQKRREYEALRAALLKPKQEADKAYTEAVRKLYSLYPDHVGTMKIELEGTLYLVSVSTFQGYGVKFVKVEEAPAA